MNKKPNKFITSFAVIGAFASIIFASSAIADSTSLTNGKYEFVWRTDDSSGTDQVCLSDVKAFANSPHVAAIFFNDFKNTCSSSSQGGGVYNVSCYGQLVEGTLTLGSETATGMSVSGGLLLNVDGQGTRRRLTVFLSAKRIGDC